MFVNFFGLLSLVCLYASFYPQYRNIWVNRRNYKKLCSYPKGSHILCLVMGVSFLIYGLSVHAFWLCFFGFCTSPFTVMSMYFIDRARRVEENERLRNAKVSYFNEYVKVLD